MKKMDILNLLQIKLDERYNNTTNSLYLKFRGVQVNENSNLELDLGLDSLDRIELWIELEEKCKINIPEIEIKQIVVVKYVINLVKKYQKTK